MGNMVSYFVAKNLLQDRYFLFDDLEGEHSILFAIYVSKAKIQVWEGLKINTQTQKSPWMQLGLGVWILLPITIKKKIQMQLKFKCR
jgi:hypothetical protein